MAPRPPRARTTPAKPARSSKLDARSPARFHHFADGGFAQRFGDARGGIAQQATEPPPELRLERLRVLRDLEDARLAIGVGERVDGLLTRFRLELGHRGA